MAQIALSHSDVLQNLHHLIRCLGPGHCRAVHLFERVDDILVVQGYVRYLQSGAVAGIEGGIPLFVAVAEPDHHQIAGLDQRFGSDLVDLGRLVVPPEIAAFIAKNIAGGLFFAPDFWFVAGQKDHFVYKLEYDSNEVLEKLGGLGKEPGQFT